MARQGAGSRASAPASPRASGPGPVTEEPGRRPPGGSGGSLPRASGPGPVTEEPGRRPPGGSGGSLPRASTAVARSPIAPAPPVVVAAGWEVSGRRASGALTLTDCTPLTKMQLRAPVDGEVAASLGVPFGRAARDPDGTLVVGSGPGEWLLLAAPGRAGSLEPMLERA